MPVVLAGRTVLVASRMAAESGGPGSVSTFAEMIAAQREKQRICDDQRIRAQARKRAAKLKLDPDLMEAHAARARAFLDPEPALQKAAQLTRADMVLAGLLKEAA